MPRPAVNSFVWEEPGDNPGEQVMRKFSQVGFHREFATRMLSRVRAYVSQLQSQTISTPRVLDYALYEQEGLYHIGLTVEFDDGISLDDLRGQELLSATENVISTIGRLEGMPGDPDELRVPVDATFPNLHLHADRPGEADRIVLIDTLPPLVRDPDGRFPLEMVRYSAVRPDAVRNFLGRKSWRACDLVRSLADPKRDVALFLAPSGDQRVLSRELSDVLYDFTAGFPEESRAQVRELMRDGMDGFEAITQARYIQPVLDAKDRGEPGYPPEVGRLFPTPPSVRNRIGPR